MLLPAPVSPQTANGIGLIAFESATLVTLAGCRVQDRAPLYTIQDPTTVCQINNGTLETHLGAPSSNYACGELYLPETRAIYLLC